MPEPLFLRAPYVYVFYGAAGVLALREVVTRRIWQADTDNRLDRGTFRTLWASTAVGTGTALFLPLITDLGALGAPRTAFWAGIVLLLGGFVVRLWAMLELGSLFSHRVAVKDDHEIVETGPYRWVRHPAYTGALITYVGIGVVTGNLLSVAAATAGALVGYGRRIRVEERALRERLDDYQEYINRTPYRLVPGLW